MAIRATETTELVLRERSFWQPVAASRTPEWCCFFETYNRYLIIVSVARSLIFRADSIRTGFSRTAKFLARLMHLCEPSFSFCFSPKPYSQFFHDQQSLWCLPTRRTLLSLSTNDRSCSERYKRQPSDSNWMSSRALPVP